MISPNRECSSVFSRDFLSLFLSTLRLVYSDSPIRIFFTDIHSGPEFHFWKWGEFPSCVTLVGRFFFIWVVEGGDFCTPPPPQKKMQLNVWSCWVFLFLQWGNCWECTLESAPVLNSLNIGKLKKEMQIINFSDDACKLWQVLCQPNRAVCSSFIVQTRCGDMKPFAHFDRELTKNSCCL